MCVLCIKKFPSLITAKITLILAFMGVYLHAPVIGDLVPLLSLISLGLLSLNNEIYKGKYCEINFVDD